MLSKKNGFFVLITKKIYNLYPTMSSRVTYTGNRHLLDMVEDGISVEMDSGKIRWWPVQDSSKSSNKVVVTETGPAVSTISVSSDGQIMCYDRRGHGVYTIYLLGGDNSSFLLPIDNTGLSGNISSIHVLVQNQTGIVFASDDQGKLVRWNLKVSKSKIPKPQLIGFGYGKITSLNFQDDTLYAAIHNGVQLVIIDSSTGDILQEYPVIATPPISKIIPIPIIDSILVASQHRHITIYSLRGTDVIQHLACDSVPIFVDYSPYYWDKTHVHILSVSDNNEVSIWKITGESKNKPIQPMSKIVLSKTSKKGHLILSAKFVSKNQIRVAYGSYLKPIFEDIVYHNKGHFTKKEHVIQSIENGLLMTEDENVIVKEVKSEKKTDSVHLVGPIETKIPLPKEKDEGDMEIEEETMHDETPFGQLLKKKRSRKKDTKSVPKTSSAVEALTSALNTKDTAMLNDIISKTDEKFVSTTVKMLPASLVLTFLTELLSSFSKRPTLKNIIWTRQLLITHQSYLSSSPNLIPKLSGLYNTIDERLQHFPELLKLNGRLDLLLAHSKELNEINSSGNVKAFQVYEEEDDYEDFGDDMEDLDQSNSDIESDRSEELDGFDDDDDGDDNSMSDE